MSVQPSTPREPDNFSSGFQGKIVELTRLLIKQPNLESLLACVISGFNAYLKCDIKISVIDSVKKLLDADTLKNNKIELLTPTPLMGQASLNRSIEVTLNEASLDENSINRIAIPIIINEEVIGVIQAERNNLESFTPAEISLAQQIIIQASIFLQLKYDSIIRGDNQAELEDSKNINLIYKSFLTNLDFDNLINSILTLLYQNFGFKKVNLFLVHDSEKVMLSRIGISNQGIDRSTHDIHEHNIDTILRVINEKKGIWISNTKNDEDYSSQIAQRDCISQLFLPLATGDQVLGALELCSVDENFIAPIDVDYFSELSQNIAIAVRNAKLFHTEQVKSHAVNSLNELISSVTADTSVEDIANKILTQLQMYLPSDFSAIWLTTEDTEAIGIGQFTSSLHLIGFSVSTEFSKEILVPQDLDVEDIKDKLLTIENNPGLMRIYPWLWEMYDCKCPLLKTISEIDDTLKQLFSLESEFKILAIPLHIGDKDLGVLLLMHRSLEIYNNESIDVASAITNIVSIGLENAKLFSGAHDQVWISTLLLQVTEICQSMNSISELFDALSRLLIELVGANATSIYLWDESLNAFCPQAISGFDNEQRTRLQEWDVVSGTVSAFDQLMQNQTPVIMNNQSISDELANLIFPNYDLSSNLLIIFPITLAGNTIGAFLTDFSGTKLETEASQKSWDDMYTIVQGVAQQAGLAYENIERVTSKEEEAYISVALLQVAQAIVSLNQLDEILEFIVRITPILVGVKRCIIFTWDHIARVFKLARYYGFSKAEIEFARQEIEMDDFPFISTVLNQNQITYDHLDQNDSPLNWMDISPSEINTIQGISMEVNGDAIENLNIETLREKGRLLLGFPLSVKGDVLGVMVIEEEEISKGLPSYHIREKRIEIVNGITQLAAVAMKNELLQQEALNSEKLERELQLAREIQQAFLPHSLPTFPGWDIDVHWEPARQVGGDFYDIILIEKNKIGFVIADVADKGMPAALFMTLIRTLIRAAAKDTLSPSSVLRQVNDLLLQDSKNSMFVTVFYGVIDLLSGDLVYSNAGHNPPIVKSIASGEFIELTRTSMALGIFEDIAVEEREFSLKSGDWVLFYTDGVTEAFSPSEEMFGIQRLNELLKERIFSSSKELVNAVQEDVLDFIKDAELSDDLTLAAIFKS